MTTLADTIIIKSDQLNGDDLFSGPITITITKLTKKAADSQQPISVHFKDDGGKPWKPCLTMRKLLLAVWGDNVDDIYIGRRLTLYRDPTVKWAGREEGGIRISHMSHITSPQTHFLTETRGSKKPATIKPLIDAGDLDIAALKKGGALKAAKGLDQLKEWWKDLGGVKQNAIGGAAFLEELKAIAAKAATTELQTTEKTDTDSVPAV